MIASLQNRQEQSLARYKLWQKQKTLVTDDWKRRPRMSRKSMLRLGSASVLVLTITGCASTAVPVQCPRFLPSPEALSPIKGTGWRPLAERVIEHFREQTSPAP